MRLRIRERDDTDTVPASTKGSLMPTLTISSDVLARVMRDIQRIRHMAADEPREAVDYARALGRCIGIGNTIASTLRSSIEGTCDCGNDCDYTGQCSECRETAAAHDAGDAEYHRVAEGD